MRSISLAIALLAAASGRPVLAQTAAPLPAAAPSPGAAEAAARGRLDTMLKTGHAEADWFSDSFLARVPVSKVDEIVGQLTAILGAYQGIDGSHGDYTAHFEKGTDEMIVQLDAANHINAILFRPAKF